MTKHLFFRVLLFSFLLIFSSCSEDDVEVGSSVNPEILPQPLSPPQEIQNIQNEAIANVITTSELTASVLVSVKNEFGEAVDGASVTISGESQVSENGTVVFRGLQLNKDFVGIKVSHQNYITAVKNFTPTNATIYNLEVVLFEGELKTLPSSSGANLQFNSGVQLTFEADSFVNADGSVYEGIVSVNTYYHNNTQSDYLLAQPGALVGLDGDQLSALATEGIVTVDLTSASGNEVFIREGKSVKVTMPAEADAPATIDLWNLNEKHGIWVKTGIATKNGSEYEFEVTHFSTYNLGYGIDSLEEVNIIVRDLSFIGHLNQFFEVSVNGVNIQLVKTDSGARFTLLNAPRGEYQLKLVTCDDSDVIVSNVITLDSEGEFIIEIDAFQDSRPFNFVTFQGNVINCENRINDDDILTLTIFKNTENEKTIISSLSDIFFIAQVWICSNINLDESTDVEFNYNQGEYIGTKNLSSFTITGTVNSITYETFRESSAQSICDLSGGEAVDLDASVERIIKNSFGFTEDQVLTTSFTEQVKVLNLFPIDNFFEPQVELNTVDLEAIVRYFPNLEELRLSVGSNNNVGSLLNFDQIASLNNLNILSVSGGQITDLSVLNSLTNLRSLTLNDNDITDVSVLSNLLGLEKIRISNNQDITDFSFLNDLVNLNSIELTRMNITDISFLILNNELLNLRLENNNISDISSLSQLTSLQTLVLDGNNISDISSLSQLNNLQFLTISQNSISDISVLSQLLSLTRLQIQNNNIADITSIASLQNLVSLNLSDNPLSDISALTNLNSLDFLVFFETNVNNLNPLFGLTSLISLDFSGDFISQEQVDELRNNLPFTTVSFF